MTEEKFEKVLKIFYAFQKTHHGIIYYPFQKEIIERVLRTVLFKTGEDIYFQISRQAGKTEALVGCVEFLMIFHPKLMGDIIRIGIFAPQREQTKTDFDRLKYKLEKGNLQGFKSIVDPNESNAITLQLANGSYCYTFPLTITSRVESKTLDLIIYEEANSIDDIQKKRKSDPMGTNTNAPRISVGVAGTAINFFYKAIQKEKNAYSYPQKEIVKQKREAYNKDKDETHLYYEKFLKSQIALYGEDDDAFRTQYELEWIIGIGQFLTREDLNAIKGDFEIYDTKHEVVVGIDTAKSPDKTIVTVKDIEDKKLCGWLEIKGENYEDQYYIIEKWLAKRYPNVVRVAIDSTGQGDFMPDMFENHSDYEILPVKFSLQSKDVMYKNLLIQVRNKGTKYPKTDCKEREHFEMQLLDLQKEYKGEYMSCHHPKDPKTHDDYPDSWALAELAHKDIIENGVEINIIDTKKKKKHVINEEEDSIIDIV